MTGTFRILAQGHIANQVFYEPTGVGCSQKAGGRGGQAIMIKLSREVRPLFSGSLDRHRPSSNRIARNFDFKRTLAGNLRRWSPSHGKLFIEKPFFMSRVKRHTERWQPILLVDQSGSMVESVIHSAVMAAC